METPARRKVNGLVAKETANSFLFVDDNTDFLTSIQDFLKAAMPDWRVQTESDPIKALTRLAGERFDVVVADYRMPGMDGLRFLEKVRRLNPKCRLVLATGHPDAPVTALDKARAGILVVLVKPLATQPFLDRLKAIVESAPPAG